MEASVGDDWKRRMLAAQSEETIRVVLKAVDRPEQALALLRQSGAYDISTRLRTAAPQAGVNPNEPPQRYNQSAPPPPTYNPNAPPLQGYSQNAPPPPTGNPNVPPETRRG